MQAPGPTRDLRSPSAPEVERGPLTLLVVGSGVLATYPLPERGEVTIGRGQGCEIRVDDGSVSRKHAVLRLGPPITIEDLGSANGTRLRDAPLASGAQHTIAVGEAVQLGSVMLLVQSVATGRPRRVWTHGYFEARVEEECARAARSGAGFALARVELDRDLPTARVQDALAGALRACDVVGAYGPNQYELMLVDTAADAAAPTVERVRAQLASLGATVHAAVVCYPRDGRDAYTLAARLGEEARGDGKASRTAERDVEAAIVVKDATMQHLHTLVSRIAQGNINVLILGETGVGKEVFAEQVHRSSPRAQRPFLKLDCGALPETLLESELFGHERGAFTSAVAQKAGLLETAQGGTVFLDEVGELPPSIQMKLLRVIEARQVRRVGGLERHPIDVRFVAATNRNLEAEIARGVFRQDLYFRLNGFALVIPPLRHRVGEIEGLARHFAALAARHNDLPRPPDVSNAALALLQGYTWPGNLRELRNVIERAALLCAGRIEPEHLPIEKMRATFAVGDPGTPYPDPGASRSPERGGSVRERPGVGLKGELRELERQRILGALEAHAGNQTLAAKALGISRRTLLNRLDEFGIKRPRKR